MDWQEDLIADDASLRSLLRETRRIAVLGIKPESRKYRPAHFVPRYLQRVGYDVIPVPVYYPDVESILGRDVYREVAAIPGPVDVVDVFRKPNDIPPHLPDLMQKRPTAVWFQLGIRNDDAAETLARAGIRVVQDRCLMVEHRRLLGGTAEAGPS